MFYYIFVYYLIIYFVYSHIVDFSRLIGVFNNIIKQSINEFCVLIN